MEKQIYLGSKSPRRAQLLSQAGFEFKLLSTDEDEVIDESIPSKDMPEYLAIQKADFIQPQIKDENFFLITADTIVLLGDKIIGKPKDLEDAKAILQSLSGATHQVISGVCLTTKSNRITFSEVAEVTFKDLTDKEIEFYIENYEVLDKAGAYAIQEWIGLIGIKFIRGSYYNIMGLPVQRVYEELNKL